MELKKTDHWDLENISDAFIFCIQRLDELLFDYTIDSYKPRALNPPSLCFELLNVINEVEEGNIDKNNIRYILDELKLSVQKDMVAKKLITSNIDYYVGYNENTSYSELRLRISVLERSLERYRYISALQAHLLKAVKENKKDEIDALLSCYMTTFINWGISKQFLYHKMNKFFYDENHKIDSDEKLKEFLVQIFPKLHTYRVYFRVQKNILLLKKSFKFFNIKLVEEINDELKGHFERHNFNIRPKQVIIEIVDIKVPDPFIARDTAEDRLETIRNTSQLFYHQSKLNWNNAAIVIQHCCSNESILAKNQINPMKKSLNYKSTEVASNTNEIFQNIALRGESFKKFNRIMELHSNCLNYSTAENQIVNLWTILETLVPSSNKRSKVESICNAIIPILTNKYFEKLILNLYSDFQRWNKETMDGYIKDIDTTNDLKKLALFLCCEQYSEDRNELYGKLGIFALLRNRLFKMSQLLCSKEKTQNRLEIHKKYVKWQIRRVYRTRNMIVHSGKSPRYINILVENTHDYIDQVTAEIIEMTTSNYRVKNLDQAFEFGKIINSELEKIITNSGKPEEFVTHLIKDSKI